MESGRFGKTIVVTAHAQLRMSARNVTDALLLDLIETGDLRCKDVHRLWIAKRYPDRNDNLICVAVVLETVLLVKTVMHHFSWEPQP
jgi:hypothetical protein